MSGSELRAELANMLLEEHDLKKQRFANQLKRAMQMLEANPQHVSLQPPIHVEEMPTPDEVNDVLCRHSEAIQQLDTLRDRLRAQ